MITQQVEEVFPEWVGTDTEGYKTLTYRGFEALTVESFRELQTESDRLKADKPALSAKSAAQATTIDQLASLEKRLTSLEKRSVPQHASILGEGSWPFAVLFSAALCAAPFWLRRRRNDASSS